MDDEGNLYLAPNSLQIIGTSEQLTGTCGVYFGGGDPDTDFEHDGNGTKVDWNEQSTFQVEQLTVFVDEEGEEWLSSHLISNTQPALPDGVLSSMREQLKVGRALSLARRSADMVSTLQGTHTGAMAAARLLVLALETHYRKIVQLNDDALAVFAQPGTPIDG